QRSAGFTLFPYTTLFRSVDVLGRALVLVDEAFGPADVRPAARVRVGLRRQVRVERGRAQDVAVERPAHVDRVAVVERVDSVEARSEEHTSELQSLAYIVC